MLPEKLSKRVLTVGCAYRRPRGGVAQVLNSYATYVFPRFRFVCNSAGGGRLRKLWLAAGGLAALAGLSLTNRRIKIVHIHTASYNSFRRSALYVSLARALGKKVVLHIHGGGFREYCSGNEAFVRRVLDRADRIVALSDSWQAYFSQTLGYSNVSVVHNIIAPPAVQELPPDGRIHALFLGRLCREKGIYDLVDAVVALPQEVRNRLTVHIGGSGEEAEMTAAIHQAGLNDCFVMEGWVDGPKKTTLLNRADFFVLPSYIEGLPISVLEAMSHRLPILATPVGGIPEIVGADNGLLVEPGNVAALSDAIARLVADAPLRRRMGEASWQKVQPYLPENIERELTRLYTELLNEPA